MNEDDGVCYEQYKYNYPKNFIECLDLQIVDFNNEKFEMKNIYAKPLPYNYRIEKGNEHETDFMKDHKYYQQCLEEVYFQPRDRDCLDKIDVSNNTVVTSLIKTMIYNARVDQQSFEEIFGSIERDIKALKTEEEREREWRTLREIFQLIQEEKREQGW